MVDPVIELQNGRIRGVVEKHEEGFDYYSFKGIPYAEPPVGDLRLKDPIPRKKWVGEIDCQNYGPMCLQHDYFSNTTSYNEDCLHLNVFTKLVDQPSAKIPVIVVIHGGLFMCLSSSDLYHGPGYLIRKDVVIVTINYRLGVLGFLNLEDEIAPGNQGLKDQILALQWVRQNIHVFGGDPDNVTVLGMGAGGVSAHYLALSPLAKGLIHKVISQSSVIYNTWHKVMTPKLNAVKLCSLLGKELTESKEIYDFLRTVDPVALLEAQERLRLFMNGHLHFGPGIDDKSQNPVMPVDPEIAANQGIPLPYLAGYNAQESIMLLIGLTREQFFDKCESNFGEILKYNAKDILNRYNITETQIKKLYYKNEVVSDKNMAKLIEFTTDLYFVEGMHRFARVQVEKSSTSTYLYVYSYDDPGSISKKIIGNGPRGVSHLDELPCLFKMQWLESIGIDYVKKGTRSYKMMEQMTELWTNFAKHGRPTVEITDLIPVHWLPINDGTVIRYFSLDEDITMQSSISFDQRISSARNIKV